VPLGAFLSGGIDSSAVVGLMSRLAPEPVHTFHVSFEGAGRRGVGDERGYARAVAARAGTHHHELVVTQRQAIDELPAILDALAEPLGTDSFVPTYLLAEAARQHVTVALSGDGPDELFGGYGIHRAEAAYQLLQALPRVLHAHVLPPLAAWLPASGEGPFSIRVRRLQRLLSGAAGDAPERYFRWLRLWPDERRRTLLAGGILSDDGEERARELVRREMTRFPLDPTNNLLFFDARVRLPNHVLMKVDLASMRHALEVRSPFLDYRVAELAFRIGGRAKVRGNRGKRLLVDAVRDLLPPHVSGRGKQGFDLPVGQWLRRELAPLYRDVVTRDRLRTMGILNAEAVERLYREHCAGWRDHSWTLWTVLVLCWWWFSPHGPSGSGVATHPPLRVVA
jgi:asparagine synthase (glutamine-hydrolysing)